MRFTKFKIRYFRNPLALATSKQRQRGRKLFHQGMHNLKVGLKENNPHVNLAMNTRKAIHGLSYCFGFRYRKLLQDNFLNQRKQTLQWINTINNLKQSLKKIHHYSNFKALFHSKLAPNIQISGIQKYYHPRNQYLATNARTTLAKLGQSKRHNFTGKYKRFGSKKNGQLTILLTDVRYHHQLVTDHLWFNATKGFQKLGNLKTGDLISFRARIKKYSKGYLPAKFKQSYDYGLCYPTKIRKI